jgi:hypothetical protein
MKSILGKSPVKKTMRVATAFTGVAAGVAGFAPAAEANSQVGYPYVLWVNTKASASNIQACGYKDVGTGEWYCTAREGNPHTGNHSNYFGGNWKDGKVNIYEWHYIQPSLSSEVVHTCNTNGAYHGVFRGTGTGFGVSLSGGYHAPLGMSTGVEC